MANRADELTGGRRRVWSDSSLLLQAPRWPLNPLRTESKPQTEAQRGRQDPMLEAPGLVVILVSQLCLTLRPRGILWVRILEWIAIPFSRTSS